jgi:nicotinamidase-related amidase
MDPMQSSADAAEIVPRSPEVMSPDDTGLLVIDMQEKLLAAVPAGAQIVWNVRRLLEAAALLGLHSAATEQYPEALGQTVGQLKAHLPAPLRKLTFSGAACGPCAIAWPAVGVDRVLLCGVETHICIAQTALDLTAAGFTAYVAVDAVGSRHAIDHETALRRLESAGVIMTTTEAAMFEWCRTAGTPEFKQISALAKETPP